MAQNKNKLTLMAQNKYSASSFLSLSFYILSPRIPIPATIPTSDTGYEAVSGSIIPRFPIQGWPSERELSGGLQECSTIYMGREGMMKTWVCKHQKKWQKIKLRTPLKWRRNCDGAGEGLCKWLVDELNKGQEEQRFTGSQPNGVRTLALCILSPIFCLRNQYLFL